MLYSAGEWIWKHGRCSESGDGVAGYDDHGGWSWSGTKSDPRGEKYAGNPNEPHRGGKRGWGVGEGIIIIMAVHCLRECPMLYSLPY